MDVNTQLSLTGWAKLQYTTTLEGHNIHSRMTWLCICQFAEFWLQSLKSNVSFGLKPSNNLFSRCCTATLKADAGDIKPERQCF